MVLPLPTQTMTIDRFWFKLSKFFCTKKKKDIYAHATGLKLNVVCFSVQTTTHVKLYKTGQHDIASSFSCNPSKFPLYFQSSRQPKSAITLIQQNDWTITTENIVLIIFLQKVFSINLAVKQDQRKLYKYDCQKSNMQIILCKNFWL
jgi:hypothetical protein